MHEKETELFTRVLGNVDLAKRVCDLLTAHVSIPSREQLTRIYGIGERKADIVLACMEMSSHYFVGTEAKSVIAPEDVLGRIAFLKFVPQEHFVVITLDSSNHIINVHDVTKGLVSQTPVHPREVFRCALQDSAVSVIVAHNHPSGSTTPSNEDVAITRVIVAAGKIMQVPVIDHIIISRSGYLSMCRDTPDMFERKDNYVKPEVA